MIGSTPLAEASSLQCTKTHANHPLALASNISPYFVMLQHPSLCGSNGLVVVAGLTDPPGAPPQLPHPIQAASFLDPFSSTIS